MQIWVNPPMQILTMGKGAQGMSDQQSTTHKGSVKLPPPHTHTAERYPNAQDTVTKEVQTNTKQAV